jgi:hypothetical protein
MFFTHYMGLTFLGSDLSEIEKCCQMAAFFHLNDSQEVAERHILYVGFPILGPDLSEIGKCCQMAAFFRLNDSQEAAHHHLDLEKN